MYCSCVESCRLDGFLKQAMIVVKMAMVIAIIITIPMTPTTTPKSNPLTVNGLVAVV